MERFLNAVGSVVWGPPMLFIFIFTALRFSFSSRFFQIRGFFTMIKETLFKMFSKTENNGISQFGAFCSVLGACIGTGNIVGVATAIYSGGPGTVFWMWISAILSMMTAYSENYLGVSYRRKDKYGVMQGGAFFYIEKGIKMKGLAKVYAFFSLFSVIGMGNLAQSNSVSESLFSGFNANKYVVGFISAFLCFIIISGSVERISKFGTFIVPVMTFTYLILSFMVLVKFRANIIPAASLVFKEAFSLKAINGFGMFKAMRYGVSRGVFSNEAGLGSSTLIHAESNNQKGETQGMWAMLEVFIDTVFLCTITALVILVNKNNFSSQLYGADLSIAAYSTIGEIGRKGIAILTAVFAFTSLSSCSFYGEKSFAYLFGKKHINLYKAFYILLIFIGSINPPKIIWEFSDICNGLMAIPNLFAINCLGKEVEYPKKCGMRSAECGMSGKLRFQI